MSPIGSINEAGTYSRDMVLPSSINEASNAPVISGLNPPKWPVGGADITLTVTGAKFTVASVVNFGAIDRSTTFVNAGALTIRIRPSNWGPGAAACFVKNGAIASNAVSFTWTAA